jgi:myo-inositol-1(or 4)-monophosphatase
MDLYTLTAQVCDVATQAGHFLKEQRAAFDRSSVVEKGPHDYVSYVDKMSEQRLVTQLSALLPEAGFVTEEKTTRQYTEEEYCWVIDPLDGTTNFIHDMAPYCVSIALRSQTELLIGVVYEVCRNECYWAYKGGGAYLNGRPISVTDIASMNQAQILLGFPYDSEHFRPVVLGLIEQMYGTVGAERLLGSAAVELCYVAAGRAEARIEGFLGPWDVAAGCLILSEAGGRVTDFSGGDTHLSGREVLASNGHVHEQLLRVVAKACSKV